MGCVQSQHQSPGHNYNRNSRNHGYHQKGGGGHEEFYHQHYHPSQPQSYHHTFVTTKPVKELKHNPPPPLDSQRVLANDINGRSGRPSTTKKSNNLHQSPVSDNGSFSAKKSSSKDNDDMHFRRQHFDRNSIIRQSKKRPRRSSSSVTSPGDRNNRNTPVRDSSVSVKRDEEVKVSLRKASEPPISHNYEPNSFRKSQEITNSFTDHNDSQQYKSASESVAALLNLNVSNIGTSGSTLPNDGLSSFNAGNSSRLSTFKQQEINKESRRSPSQGPEIDDDGGRLI